VIDLLLPVAYPRELKVSNIWSQPSALPTA
jgi:hypothetical protein